MIFCFVNVPHPVAFSRRQKPSLTISLHSRKHFFGTIAPNSVSLASVCALLNSTASGRRRIRRRRRDRRTNGCWSLQFLKRLRQWSWEVLCRHCIATYWSITLRSIILNVNVTNDYTRLFGANCPLNGITLLQLNLSNCELHNVFNILIWMMIVMN